MSLDRHKQPFIQDMYSWNDKKSSSTHISEVAILSYAMTCVSLISSCLRFCSTRPELDYEEATKQLYVIILHNHI